MKNYIIYYYYVLLKSITVLVLVLAYYYKQVSIRFFKVSNLLVKVSN